VNIKMIKKKVKEYIIIMKEIFTKEISEIIGLMEKELCIIIMEIGK